MHKELPQSTVKLVLPSNESYESKTGCNRTLAIVLWVPLNFSPQTMRRENPEANSGKLREESGSSKAPCSLILPSLILGTFKPGGKQTGGNDICVATGIAVRCRRDARCRHCTGKRLSRTIWSSFNKEKMSHLCDSTVAGPTAQRNNVLASKCEYPPFRYPF